MLLDATIEHSRIKMQKIVDDNAFAFHEWVNSDNKEFSPLKNTTGITRFEMDLLGGEIFTSPLGDKIQVADKDENINFKKIKP